MRDNKAALLVVAGLLLGVCWAEGGELGGPHGLDPSLLQPEVVQRIYVATEEPTLARQYPVLELAKEASRQYVMYNGLPKLTGGETPISACAFADGSGGVPKISGGGEDLFGPRAGAGGQPVLPAALALDGLAWTNAVVIDEFDFGELDGEGPHAVEMTGGSGGLTLGLYDLLRGTMPIDPLDPPHGNLVVFHILRLAAPTGTAMFQRLPISGPTGQALWTVDVSGRRLVLIDVDYDDSDSVFSSLGLIARGAVVNLSWNIFECDIIDDYESVSNVLRSAGTYIPTLVDYLKAAFETVQGSDAFAEKCAELLPTPPDPTQTEEERCASVLALAAVLEMEHFADNEHFADIEGLLDPEEGPAATVYAATGNQGLPFALPPASWQGVNAVAACFQSNPLSGMAQFSNAPLKLGGADANYEFTAPGAWFALNFVGPSDEPLGYWGTSFAAPNVAILSAAGTLAAAAGAPAASFLGCAP